uniref:Uncharacterized protein n=1 Tax=Terrapene triunguis TaxID=2587831 RepID=A0A674IBL7_9SAUR
MGLWPSPLLMPFLLNAIKWLGAGKKGRIGINPNLKSVHDLLTQQKVVCEISALTDNLSIYCCQSYSDTEAKKIHEFVSEGGGLVIGGQNPQPVWDQHLGAIYGDR